MIPYDLNDNNKIKFNQTEYTRNGGYLNNSKVKMLKWLNNKFKEFSRVSFHKNNGLKCNLRGNIWSCS